MNKFLIPLLMVCLMAAQAKASSLSDPLDGRIVGGLEAPIQQFPHQASLQRNGKHICGAIIIQERILLTAAHCVDRQTTQTFTVRVGSTESSRGGSLLRVQRIIVHEDYNKPTSLNNDIALLFLDRPLQFNRSILPVPLLTKQDLVQPGASFFVSGWGATSPNAAQSSPRLRYTSVEEINHTKCMSAYRGLTKVTSTMICAGVPKGGRDSCQGDSGGPLITYVDGTRKLVGIVSWGISCAHASYPGVYTRVTEYDNWIKDNIKLLEF